MRVVDAKVRQLRSRCTCTIVIELCEILYCACAILRLTEEKNGLAMAGPARVGDTALIAHPGVGK